MKFKQLINDMMENGWRVYYLPSKSENILSSLSHRRNLEIITYDGKPFVLIKNSYKKK